MRMELITATAMLLQARDDAREIDDTIASQASRLAELLLPNVRRLSGSQALALKTALRDFDMRSQTWKPCG